MARKKYEEYKAYKGGQDGEYQMVDFRNDSDTELDLIMRDSMNIRRSVGKVPAKTTAQLPRAVAEYFASRNLHYHILNDEVGAAIEADKAEMKAIEDIQNMAEKQKAKELETTKELKDLEKELEADKLKELKAIKAKKAEEKPE